MGQQRIKLYQGSVNECSYLPDRTAINIYADPHHPQPAIVYNQLIGRGFRRSGEYIYRPGCGECNACVPVRILCEEFQPRRRDRRTLKANSDLNLEYRPAGFTEEYFDLYCRYLNARHADSDMNNPDPQDFERFLLNPWGETIFIVLREGEALKSVAVTDVTSDGLSAVYTFFDPDCKQRALGRYSILCQIEMCTTLSFSYLYLGYWVDGCQKMDYKIDYLPQEHYRNEQWCRYES